MGEYYSLDLRERAVAAYLGGESARPRQGRDEIPPSLAAVICSRGRARYALCAQHPV